MPRETCRYCEGRGFVQEGTAASYMLGLCTIVALYGVAMLALGICIGKYVTL